jgi:formylglycine-generating enzyme required for sulfatase activity
VWEWTLDVNGVVVPHDSRGAGRAHDAHDHRVFCASAAIGASDPSDYAAFLRYAMRAALTPPSTVSGVGFRCAANLAA